jgi:hypothetical protein
MACVEKNFELQGRKCKWEEYKGTRYSEGNSTDDTSTLVAMLVNSSELRASDFPLLEVRPRHGGSRRPSYARRDSEKT